MPGHKHTVFQTLSEELAEITITCTAPTKTFNLAGVGVSNIIIKNKKLREKFRNSQEKSATHVFSPLPYRACEIAYSQCEEWLTLFLELVDRNQETVNQFFEEKFIELKAPLIEGTYLQWIDFRALGLKNEELKKFMNEKAKLFFSEGYTFGEKGSGFERINLAVPSAVLEKALDRLYNAIKEDFSKLCK